MREFGCIYAQSSNHNHGKRPATKKSCNTFRHFGTSQESSGADSNHMSGSESNGWKPCGNWRGGVSARRRASPIRGSSAR